jgi:hypothetical protein
MRNRVVWGLCMSAALTSCYRSALFEAQPDARAREAEAAVLSDALAVPEGAAARQVVDGSTADARVPDAPTADARVPDAPTADARAPDALSPDVRGPDAPAVDVRAPDAPSLDVRTIDALWADLLGADVLTPDAGACSAGAARCTEDLRSVVQCRDGGWWPAGACSDLQICRAGACKACQQVRATIETKASCSISVLPGFTLDGEGFLVAGGKHRVLAMDRWGKGHVLAWCDSTELRQLLGAFKVTQYLGQTAAPRVAVFGNTWCETALGPELPYLGKTLPRSYLSDPEALARDFDVLVFCGYGQSGPRGVDHAPALVPFVEKLGKGLLVAMDYKNPPSGSGPIEQVDFDQMNALLQPSGIQFDGVYLDWGPAPIALDCVPDLVEE